MSELNVTPRMRNGSQYITTKEQANLFVLGCKTVQGTYRNVSGAAESAKMGQLMGVIAASGKWTVCKSGATDGSQQPRGVLCVAVTDLANAGEVLVDICNFGTIDKNLVAFKGADTFNTLVGGVRMEDLLIANAQSLRLTPVTDVSSYGNF